MTGEPDTLVAQRCRRCDCEKPIDEFDRNASLKSGRDRTCRACRRKAQRERKERDPERRRRTDREARRRYYARNVEKERERGRQRRLADIEAARELDRIRKARYPEREAARQEVKKALLRGDLVRGERCEQCDASSTQAHHEDYSKPLEVVWLCTTCHGRAHRIEEAALSQHDGSSDRG